MEGSARFSRRSRELIGAYRSDTQDPEKIIETVLHIAPLLAGLISRTSAAPKCFDIERRLIENSIFPSCIDDQHGSAIVVRRRS